MMRGALFLCVLAVAQAGFFDSLIHGSSHDTHPKVKICHKDKDLFKVEANALTVSPYPPKKNKDITVTLTGTMTKEIEKITMEVNVHYGVVPLGKHDVSLCGEIACPIPAGPFHMERTITLPSSAPTGNYHFSVHGKNERGEEVICASIDLAIES